MADDDDTSLYDVDRSAKGDRLVAADAAPPPSQGTDINSLLSPMSYAPRRDLPALFTQLGGGPDAGSPGVYGVPYSGDDTSQLPSWLTSGIVSQETQPSTDRRALLDAFDAPSKSNEEASTDIATLDTNRGMDASGVIRSRQPQVPAPTFPQAPQTPENVVTRAIGAFANPLMWLAIAGGAMTRRPAINALTAAAGLMQGMNQKDFRKAYLQQHKFRNSVKDLDEQTAREQEAYGEILDNPDLSAEEQLNRLNTWADAFQDPNMKGYVANHDLGSARAYWEGRQQLHPHLKKAQDRYSEAGARLTKKEQDRQRDMRANATDERAKNVAEYREDPDLKNPYLMDKVRRLNPEYNQRKSPGGQRAAARGGGISGPEDIKSLADGIESGNIPPSISLYRQKAPVAAELERRGFNLSQATTEWNAAQRAIAALNSNQQRRVLGLSESVINTIDEAKRLTKLMDQGGIVGLNQLQLKAYVNMAGNSENGKLAARYLATMNTLKEEFANLAQGGYAPTLPVWELANKQINEGYGAAENLSVLDQVQKLIRYRTNALINQGGILPGGGQSRYLPSGSPAETPAEPEKSARPAPTDSDREIGRRNPEMRQRFINQFGVEP